VLATAKREVALKPAHLEREWILNARALHVDGYDTEAATIAAGWARAAGIPVTADLDELYPGVEKLLQNVDYLIVSRDIPCRLMGERDLEMSLRQMQRRYGCCLTAATLGDNGVLAWDGKQLYQLSAYSVPVVDTTGAGDSEDIFRIGVADDGLRRGDSLEIGDVASGGCGDLRVEEGKIGHHLFHAGFRTVVGRGIAGIGGLQVLLMIDFIDESNGHGGHQGEQEQDGDEGDALLRFWHDSGEWNGFHRPPFPFGIPSYTCRGN